MKKKCLSIVTAFALLLSTLTIQVFASDSSQASLNEAKNFVLSFGNIYNDDGLTTYTILDLDGNNITDKYINLTRPWYNNEEYLKIYDYFYANVDSMTEIHKGFAKSSDISKTETKRVELFCEWTGEMDKETPELRTGSNNGKAVYYVRGTIAYNPNTYVVSSINRPVRTGGLKTEGTWRTNLNPYIIDESSNIGSTGKLYGQFTYTVHIKANFEIDGVIWSVLNYGSYSSTLTIEAGE